MPKKTPESFNYLSNDPEFVPDPEIEEFMEEEIAHAPKDPDLLAQRLHNNTAASPSDAGGDLDADWEDVNETGSEAAGVRSCRFSLRSVRKSFFNSLPLSPMILSMRSVCGFSTDPVIWKSRYRVSPSFDFAKFSSNSFGIFWLRNWLTVRRPLRSSL